nr:hypothetical transcript [Hymenolepis microstoma]
MEENCYYFGEFEDMNLSREAIYSRYKNLIGNYIDNKLVEKSSKLNLQNIFEQIHSQSQFCDGEIYELLCVVFDFEHFNEFMLDFKNV